MNIPQEALSTIRAWQSAPPVDVLAIANALGLNVYADDLPAGISGKLALRPDYGSRSGYAIIVNQREALVRQRFTVAHEIGHYVLHKNLVGSGINENTLYRAEGMTNTQEVEANKLAADILMPWSLLSQATSAGTVSLPDIARQFNVSEVAMSIRLGIPT